MAKNPIFGPNKLKLAPFCVNNMPFLTHVKDGFEMNWDECIEVARLSDQAGLDAVVAVARWKGFPKGLPAHPSHQVFDPFIYAAAVAQATERCAIFATTHAPVVHPVWMAKQTATIDHISRGRFALNVVGGWNPPDFEMFGIPVIPRAERYDYLAEWMDALNRLWTEEDEFDFEGNYLRFKGALSRPQPLQSPRIPIMNAGHSAEGRNFAAGHADVALVSILSADDSIAEQVRGYKDYARTTYGRAIQVWTNVVIVQRETDREAEDFLRYYSEERLDEIGLEALMESFGEETSVSKGTPQFEMMRRRAAVGTGYPIVGSSETVSRALARLSADGIDGVLLTMIDQVDGVRRIASEVLPRLEAMGLREPDLAQAAR